ncbi:ubiquinol-cytochrome c reductase core subunit 1 [Umbelopsis nana]
MLSLSKSIHLHFSAVRVSVRHMQISRTVAGVTVATYPEPGLTAGLSVVVGGGPRYEDENTAGAAQYLKNFAFMNNQKRRALRIVREAELDSALLSRTLSHEYMSAQVQFLKGDEDYFTEILADVICRQKFEPHEFPRVCELVRLQTIYAKSQVNIVGFERAHQLAFRNGLGNPIFSDFNHSISHITTVRQLAQKLFTRSNIVVVGRGVDHKTLLGYVHLHFDLDDVAPTRDQSTYYGGDERILSDADNGHCTIAFKGYPLGTKDHYASLVLQKILGGETHLKWDAEQCRLAAAKSADNEITSFNVGYSDNGLLGVQINAPYHEMGHGIKAIMHAIATVKTSITDEEMSRAKGLTKMRLSNIAQSRLDSMDYVGYRVLNGYTGDFNDMMSAIETVEKKDVQKAASDIFSSKPSLVAIGRLHSLPYMDQLVRKSSP